MGHCSSYKWVIIAKCLHVYSGTIIYMYMYARWLQLYRLQLKGLLLIIWIVPIPVF